MDAVVAVVVVVVVAVVMQPLALHRRFATVGLE